MGNAVIGAAGSGASDWAGLVTPLASRCRVVAPDEGELDLAAALAARAINHVFLLRLSGAAVVSYLDSIAPLLAHGRVGVISIANIEVRAVLPAIAARLVPAEYHLFAVSDDGSQMAELRSWVDGLRSTRFVAVHRRLIALLLHNDHRGLDLAALARNNGIDLAGLIHLGAYDGEEVTLYRQIGEFPIVLVEANPQIYQRLVTRMVGQANVFTVPAAISDQDGPVLLHLSNDDQSGSILPLDGVGQAFPGTAETGTIEVQGRTVDSLFADFHRARHPAAMTNMLVSDIQGAELRALRGAETTLGQLAAILLELSFDELYTGCAQVEEIDAFLTQRGFTRVAMVSAWHPSWADAFYVRA
jgi:FkbM family methyltransferase